MQHGGKAIGDVAMVVFVLVLAGCGTEAMPTLTERIDSREWTTGDCQENRRPRCVTSSQVGRAARLGRPEACSLKSEA